MRWNKCSFRAEPDNPTCHNCGKTLSGTILRSKIGIVCSESCADELEIRAELEKTGSKEE